jgi:replication factor C subunit 1
MKASSVAAPKKLGKEMPDLEEAIEEEDENDVAEVVDDEEEELDIGKDKYIKQPKAKGGKKTAAKKAAKGDEDEDEEDGGKSSKGKGKAAATKGRGRSKKA